MNQLHQSHILAHRKRDRSLKHATLFGHKQIWKKYNYPGIYLIVRSPTIAAICPKRKRAFQPPTIHFQERFVSFREGNHPKKIPKKVTGNEAFQILGWSEKSHCHLRHFLQAKCSPLDSRLPETVYFTAVLTKTVY